jgi:hypothetical protein
MFEKLAKKGGLEGRSHPKLKEIIFIRTMAYLTPPPSYLPIRFGDKLMTGT